MHTLTVEEARRFNETNPASQEEFIWLRRLVERLDARLEHTDAVLQDLMEEKELPTKNVQAILLKIAEATFLSRSDVLSSSLTGRNADNALTASLNAEIDAVGKKQGVLLPRAWVEHRNSGLIYIRYVDDSYVHIGSQRSSERTSNHRLFDVVPASRGVNPRGR